MRLAELSRAFEDLEETSSRSAMVQIAAGLLSRASREELAPIVYLLQAQLRPPYEGVEVGLGEKLLLRAVARAYEVSERTVARRLRSAGDLGLVAASLAPTAGRKRLTVRQAYESLLAVARMAGAGSQEQKVALMAKQLGGVSGSEAKFLVRVAQGRLRAGVGDQTLLEAATLAALGDRRHKPLLEGAYNVRSDLGAIVRLAFAKGKRGLAAIGPEPGTPVRPALAQRLPSAESIIARLGTVLVEPKYDGFRLQLHRDGARVSVFSRRLENVTGMFPDLVQGLRRQLRTRRAILEGEAVVHNPETGEFLPFQVTITRKRKTRIEETARRYPLRLFAFDLLYAGRRNFIPRPQQERAKRLMQLLPFGEDDPIAVTEHITTRRPRELTDYFDEMVHRGLEGIIAKRLDAPYQAGSRGFAWVKLKRAYQSKLRDTVDVVIVGYLRGRGKRAASGIGSLLAAVYDPRRDRFRTVAKIGSGLTDAAWKVMRSRLAADAAARRPARVDSIIEPDVWVRPRYVVEVLADEVTRSPFHTCGRQRGEPGYALRFPRILGDVRADKSVTDATTEREVLDLYRFQRRGTLTAR
jgi:DNA ligase-1